MVQIEYLGLLPDYVMESIQSWDARTLFENGTLHIPEYSMSVFSHRRNSTHKFCRRCRRGHWEDIYTPCPIEFSIAKCDPVKLRGVSYFVRVHDGVKLSREETSASTLIYPGQIAAVYEFGVQKYCKLCHADGTWSSYPQFQLCDTIKWS